MVKETLLEAENKMKSAEKTLEESFASLRTGRASPMLVEKLMVDYYDVPTPLMQLATISAPEPRLLAIKPFDPTSIKTIEKGNPGLRAGIDAHQRRQDHPAFDPGPDGGPPQGTGQSGAPSRRGSPDRHPQCPAGFAQRSAGIREGKGHLGG